MEPNKQHLLDKQLKEKLYDQEVAPPDFLWENIVNEINPERTPWWKKNKYLPIIAFIFFTSSIAGIYLIRNNEKTNGLLTNNKEIQSNQTAQIKQDVVTKQSKANSTPSSNKQHHTITANRTPLSNKQHHTITEDEDEDNNNNNNNKDRNKDKKSTSLKSTFSLQKTEGSIEKNGLKKPTVTSIAVEKYSPSNSFTSTDKTIPTNRIAHLRVNQPKENQPTQNPILITKKPEHHLKQTSSTPTNNVLTVNAATIVAEVKDINAAKQAKPKTPSTTQENKAPELAIKKGNNLKSETTEEANNISTIAPKNVTIDALQQQKSAIANQVQLNNDNSTVNTTIVTPSINTATDTNHIKATTIAKSDCVQVANALLKTQISNLDSTSKNNNTSLWKVKPFGLVFQAHTNLPNVSNFNALQEDKINQNKSSIAVSGKEYHISVLYSTAIHPKIKVHIGLSYHQSNFTFNKEVTKTNIKKDTTIIYKDSAIAVVDTANNPILDSLGNPVMTFTPVADENIQTTFNTNTVQYLNTSTFGYVGIPIEIQFKQNIIGKLQLQVVTGFSWQYLMYQYNSSKDLETQVKPQTQSIKLYGSIGLGYEFFNHISLSVLLRTSFYNGNGFSVRNSTLASQILYTPEIRLGFIF